MLPFKNLGRDKGINLASADPMGGPPEDQIQKSKHISNFVCPGIHLVGLLIVVQALRTPSQKSSNLAISCCVPLHFHPNPGLSMAYLVVVCISRAHSLCRHEHPESHL
jgi:hypothetical protein